MLPNGNFSQSVLAEGGAIKPLMISPADSEGLGLCNPSVFVENGEVWLNLRNVSYTLYHCENAQRFNSRYGPLSYLNPEHDIHLRTTNFLCKLSPSLDIENYWKIDMTFDKQPLWDFIGLEDARLVRWEGHLYVIGVRRDTTTNGQGRMEFSEIGFAGNRVTEIGRYRIEPPTDSYCEKNWVPILDKPYHFVKWTNPTEIVKADLTTLKSTQVRPVDEFKRIPGLPDLRGGSQIIPWHGRYIGLVHDCDLTKTRMGQKDATYRHRWVTYDSDLRLTKVSEQFSFMGGRVEFCCGLAEYEGDLLLSFGFQDNCAFILRVPEKLVGA
jgi:hypothetical protein